MSPRRVPGGARMLDFIGSAGFMAHGFCLLWQPWLIVLYAGSDLLIFAAYTAIPVALFDFLRRRPELRDGKLIALFGSFILLCGLTHLVSAITLWVPLYTLLGGLKLLTAIVSIVTASALFPLIPVLATLPHPADLAAANEALEREVAGHRMTMAELRRSRDRLEEEVEKRTSQLAEANERLRTVARESVHRKKNLLAVVQALARQTARAQTDPAAFVRDLSGRLDALARASSAAIQDGERLSLDLESVLRSQIGAHAGSGPGRVAIGGPALALSHEAGQQICLAVHELATNAIKYGALRGTLGAVSLGWRVKQGEEIRLTKHDEVAAVLVQRLPFQQWTETITSHKTQ